MKQIATTLKFTTLLLASASLSQMALAGGPPDYEPSLVPSGANAGECYARVEIPAQYSTSQENVIVEDGYSTVEVAQPQISARQQQVLVKEASVRYEVRQPQYKTVTENMLVRPAYDKLSVSPPQFRTVTETIPTSAPRTVWKRGNPGKLAAAGYTVLSVANAGVGGRGYSSTQQYGAVQGTHCGDMCEIWCLVEEPGESMTYSRKVMTSPGDVRRTTVPAKYTNIQKQVVADPGGVREVPVPPEFRTVTVEDVVNPGGERRVDVPPKFGSVSKKTLVQGERYEWRRVVCNPGISSGNYSSGYSSGSSGGYSSGGGASSSHSSITYGGTGYNYGSTGSYQGTTRYSAPATSYGTQSPSYGTQSLGRYEGSGTNCSGTTCAGHSTAQPSTQGQSYYYGTNEPVKNPRRHKSNY